MAEKNPKAHGPEPVLTGAEKAALNDEALVLNRVLLHWPTHLQESDLVRELQLGEDDFEHRDRVDRAVLQLFWAGLVVRSGPFVIPTRPTLHYHRLGESNMVDL
jgi:hypothetical protein